jgi:hypothetical protein
MTIEISYIGDLTEVAPDDTIIVNNDADYVQACRALAMSLKSPVVKRIWVRQKSHFHWLQNFVQQIGINCTLTEKTPRLLLAEKWQVELPEWLDDTIVISQKLLRLDIVPGSASSLAETVLKRFLGTIWLAESLEMENLAPVMVSLTRPEIKELCLTCPIIIRCLEEKVKVWADNSKHPWVWKVCQRLSNDTDNLWKDLTLWSLLAGYPSRLLDYVVTPGCAIFLRSIPTAAVSGLPLHPVAVEQALTQIEMFFTEMRSQINSSSNFAKALECISGRLEKEFLLFYGLLKAGQFAATIHDIDLVRQKFKGCPGVNAAKLAGLSRFVKPPRPTCPEPGEEWAAPRWLKWTVEEYIPFRHWQTQNQSYDPKVEAAVQEFSDWYLTEYQSIHINNELSLVYILDQWQDSIKNEKFSVILLIDSLPLTYWSLLQESLAKVGFHRHDQSYRFVPLPSLTENTKPKLISSKWDCGEKSYDSHLQERTTVDWGGKKSIYLPDLKSLSEIMPTSEPMVLFVNFLPSDDILHTDVESRNSNYEEELSRLFQQVAETVQGIRDRFTGNSELFSLYVITDHGACRILEEEKNSLDSKVINKLFLNEKYRMAQLAKSDAKNIPQNLWELGYRFHQPFHQEELVYFIPRGHNTVKLSGGTNGHVHGGSTPEEVIVPAAQFRPLPVSWKKLSIRFKNLRTDPKSGKVTFYIQRVIQFQIEIQNPNHENIKILRVDVISPDTEVKEFSTPTIAAKNYNTLIVDCYFNKQALEKEELHLRITFEINGEEQVLEEKIPAEFKSALTGGFSLKDL